jgi:hypothetical protein
MMTAVLRAGAGLVWLFVFWKQLLCAGGILWMCYNGSLAFGLALLLWWVLVGLLI